MAKLSKNLRFKTEREKKIENFNQLKKELEPEPDLYKEDFEELLEEYHKDLIANEASQSTIRQYIGNARRFIEEYTSDAYPLDISHMIQFKNDLLESDLKDKTRSNKITTVNRFLYYCEQGSKAQKNIVVQEENIIEHRLKHHEYIRMRNRAKAKGDFNLYWLIKIMGSMGLRFGELKFVTSRSVQNSYITISFKGTTRKVPIPQSLRYELRAYVKENDIKGKLVQGTNQNINKRLKNLAGECKVKKSKVTTHIFRHYFAYRFLQVNPSGLEKLKNILGHKSIETTANYLKATTSDYEDDMNRM